MTNTSSDSFISPTPQTSLPTSTEGSKKKKAKLDVQEQVAKVNDEIESIQSSAVSCHEVKHQHFFVKLDAKSDYHRDAKKYEWLRDTRAHKSSQAAINHQHHQEILDKEAETLRLKIQFHQMMQGSKPPALHVE
ncbi:uncharacterized protein HD556DRAFT_1443461 [Suillus plorans]|uniref:No apical meristem-associated C-terminal domain-containing protein n=1 Tax=Suillus plorans TaxID=116603 RepID=A0A9P7APG3_9AGAM|nr:uncharacterized protein HD556DRAFT_1443461 [Suillus plorans]KAG1793673.1 hypothetical protein HD556DRAFT_1443461 [Suillus plorans]